MNDDLQQRLTERNRALMEIDMDYLRRMLPTATNDYVRLLSLHKARYECTAIPVTFRHASRAWLSEQHSCRLDGTPLLPEGELPI